MAERTFAYRFTGDFKSLTAGLAAGSKSVQDFGGKLTALDRQGEQMRRGLSTVGDTAGKVGLVAAGGLAFATKAAMDWEVAWTGVLKTVNGTPAELARLEDGLRNLAKETGFAHEEVAAVAEAAGQLGISTGGIESFTETMLAMGVSTSLSSEEAAVGLARLRNIMGSTEAEIANTGSTMVALGNNFATTESEILAMSQRLAGAGRQAGLSTADVLGLSAAMSEVGIEAEAGGSAMSTTMKRIGQAVEEGGDKLDLFSRTSGMTMEEFSRAWQEDAPGALTAFVTGLGEAESMGMSTNAVLRELGITGIREADALLRLSGNAEKMGSAFESANTAFEENGALAEEAGKFYDTSAQQMKQAWAEIKDAAIEAGGVMLPIVAGVADKVGALASAFGALPGPVKTATTGLLAVTAVLGGGLWFTAKAVSGVANMRGALSDLGVSSPKAARGLGLVAKAATGLAVIQGVVVGLNALQDAMVDAVPGTEELAGRLLDLRDGTAGDLGSRFDELGDSIGRLTDSNMLEKAGDGILKVLTLGQGEGTRLQSARDEIEALDQALSGLVSSGGPEEAQAAFQALAESYSLTADEQERLLGILPGYKDALAGADNQARLTADSSEEIAGALGEVGGAADEAAEDVGTLADALSALLTPKLDLAAATDAWQAGLRNLTDGLAEGSRALKGNTDAASQNREAIRGQVSNLLSLVNAQAETGAGSKKLEGQMRRGYDAIIATGKAAGISEADMRSYLKTLGLTPKEISTIVKAMTKDAEADVTRTQGKVDKLGGTTATPKVQLNTGNALGDLQNIYSALTNLNGKTATTYIKTVRTGANVGAALAGMGSADGSTVPKDGGSYADRFPYMLAPGEEVISNRRGQADRFRPLLKAINNAADGATVGGMRFSNGGGLELTATARDIDALGRAAGSSAKGILAETRLRARHLERQSEAIAKELDASKAMTDALKAERDAIKASVDQRLRSDAFAPQDRSTFEMQRPDNWNEMTTDQQVAFFETQKSVGASLGYGQVKSPEDIIRADIAAAREMEQVLKQLKRKGLSDNVIGDLLDQGGIEMLRAYAEGTRGDISTLNKLYDRRDRVLSSASEAGGSFLRDDIRAQNKITEGLREEQRATNRALDQLNKRQERMEQLAKDNPKDTGKALGDELDKVGTKVVKHK